MAKHKATHKRGTPKSKQGKAKKDGAGKAQKAQPTVKPIDYSSLTPMEPSRALAEIVGPGKLLHTEASRRVWMYVKRHGLQDKDNRLMINADEKLKPIFGKTQVSTVELTKAVMDELKKG